LNLGWVRITLGIKHFRRRPDVDVSTTNRTRQIPRRSASKNQPAAHERHHHPEQDGSYEADSTRVGYVRNLRARVVPAASANLTEERALLLRARRERMELETARMRGGTTRPTSMSASSR
jgi:hypothetical protein